MKKNNQLYISQEEAQRDLRLKYPKKISFVGFCEQHPKFKEIINKAKAKGQGQRP